MNFQEFWNRFLIASLLIFGFGFGFYFDYPILLFISVNLTTAYDLYYLSFTNRFASIVLIDLMIPFNIYMLLLYYWDPYKIISVILITQSSDIYQYLMGNILSNTHRIYYISRNKTYEGYICGCILTLLTFIKYYPVYTILKIYILGILGGLCSSAFKRYIGIKDYSNLLGSHGGWLDRIDSMFFPILC